MSLPPLLRSLKSVFRLRDSALGVGGSDEIGLVEKEVRELETRSSFTQPTLANCSDSMNRMSVIGLLQAGARKVTSMRLRGRGQ